MKRIGSLTESVFFLILLVVTMAILTPFAWSVLSSLKDNAEIFTSTFSLPSVWHWENYKEAWFRGRFYRYALNSVIISIPTVLLVLVSTAAAGYAFAKLTFPGRKIIFYGFIFGLTIPGFSLLVNLFFTLNALGLIDQRLGVILAEVAAGIPLGIFIMRQFFIDVPDDFLDAARIDGANAFQIFAFIMLPMATPALSVVTVLTFISSWNEFALPYLLLPSDAKRTIPVGLLYFQDRFSAEYGLIFAAIVLALVPMVVIYIVFQRQFIQGLAAGSLK